MVNLMYFYGAFSVFTTASASHAQQIFIADVDFWDCYVRYCHLKMLNKLALLVQYS